MAYFRVLKGAFLGRFFEGMEALLCHSYQWDKDMYMDYLHHYVRSHQGKDFRKWRQNYMAEKVYGFRGAVHEWDVLYKFMDKYHNARGVEMCKIDSLGTPFQVWVKNPESPHRLRPRRPSLPRIMKIDEQEKERAKLAYLKLLRGFRGPARRFNGNTAVPVQDYEKPKLWLYDSEPKKPVAGAIKFEDVWKETSTHGSKGWWPENPLSVLALMIAPYFPRDDASNLINFMYRHKCDYDFESEEDEKAKKYGNCYNLEHPGITPQNGNEWHRRGRQMTQGFPWPRILWYERHKDDPEVLKQRDDPNQDPYGRFPEYMLYLSNDLKYKNKDGTFKKGLGVKQWWQGNERWSSRAGMEDVARTLIQELNKHDRLDLQKLVQEREKYAPERRVFYDGEHPVIAEYDRILREDPESADLPQGARGKNPKKAGKKFTYRRPDDKNGKMHAFYERLSYRAEVERKEKPPPPTNEALFSNEDLNRLRAASLDRFEFTKSEKLQQLNMFIMLYEDKRCVETLDQGFYDTKYSDYGSTQQRNEKMKKLLNERWTRFRSIAREIEILRAAMKQRKSPFTQRRSLFWMLQIPPATNKFLTALHTYVKYEKRKLAFHNPRYGGSQPLQTDKDSREKVSKFLTDVDDKLFEFLQSKKVEGLRARYRNPQHWFGSRMFTTKGFTSEDEVFWDELKGHEKLKDSSDEFEKQAKLASAGLAAQTVTGESSFGQRQKTVVDVDDYQGPPADGSSKGGPFVSHAEYIHYWQKMFEINLTLMGNARDLNCMLCATGIRDDPNCDRIYGITKEMLDDHKAILESEDALAKEKEQYAKVFATDSPFIFPHHLGHETRRDTHNPQALQQQEIKSKNGQRLGFTRAEANFRSSPNAIVFNPDLDGEDGKEHFRPEVRYVVGTNYDSYWQQAHKWTGLVFLIGIWMAFFPPERHLERKLEEDDVREERKKALEVEMAVIGDDGRLIERPQPISDLPAIAEGAEGQTDQPEGTGVGAEGQTAGTTAAASGEAPGESAESGERERADRDRAERSDRSGESGETTGSQGRKRVSQRRKSGADGDAPRDSAGSVGSDGVARRDSTASQDILDAADDALAQAHQHMEMMGGDDDILQNAQ